MHRIKLNFEGDVVYSTTIRIRVSDINYGGHVGNDNLVSLMHEARVRWLQSMGYTSELDIEGLGLIQKDLAVDYKHEILLGQIITIDLAIASRYKNGFTLFYRLSVEGKKVAIAFTNLLFFDYNSRSLAYFPSTFL